MSWGSAVERRAGHISAGNSPGLFPLFFNDQWVSVTSCGHSIALPVYKLTTCLVFPLSYFFFLTTGCHRVVAFDNRVRIFPHCVHTEIYALNIGIQLFLDFGMILNLRKKLHNRTRTYIEWSIVHWESRTEVFTLRSEHSESAAAIDCPLTAKVWDSPAEENYVRCRWCYKLYTVARDLQSVYTAWYICLDTHGPSLENETFLEICSFWSICFHGFHELPIWEFSPNPLCAPWGKSECCWKLFVQWVYVCMWKIMRICYNVNVTLKILCLFSWGDIRGWYLRVISYT